MLEPAQDGRGPARSRAASPARGLAWAWGLSLFASILVAGLHLYPSPAGQAVLWLISGGFLLFIIARASAGAAEGARSSCWALLDGRMRALYCAGYGLMLGGVVLTALSALTGLWQ